MEHIPRKGGVLKASGPAADNAIRQRRPGAHLRPGHDVPAWTRPWDTEVIAVPCNWPEGYYPTHTELSEVTGRLCLLIDILTVDAESRVACLPEDDPARAACGEAIGEARRILGAGPGTGLRSATAHARSLADTAERLLAAGARLETGNGP